MYMMGFILKLALATLFRVRGKPIRNLVDQQYQFTLTLLVTSDPDSIY